MSTKTVAESQRESEGKNILNANCSVIKEQDESATATSDVSKLSTSSHQVDLDSTFLWGASLLYYTGIPSPTIKEHHFTTSPSTPLSASTSTFSLFKSRSNSANKLFRSTLSLRSSEDSSEMDDQQQKRSPWRFRGGSAKKFNTLPVKGTSPMATTTPDSGFSSGPGGSGALSSSLSSLRRRHASCTSSTPTTSMVDSSGVLKGRLKNQTGSLHIPKPVTRPSLYSFMEKPSTQSLPRSPRKNRICEEIAAQQQQQENFESSTCAPAPPTPSSTASGSSSSGFKSAKRALRNSFKAAKSLLPGSSSSKIGPAVTGAGKTSLKSGRSTEKLSFFPSLFSTYNNETISTSTAGLPAHNNSSAPNTPQVIKKSRLERARKRFASTLSLHTGGGGSSSNSNNDSTSAYGYTGRSKSTSTLVISDSETGGGGIPTGAVSYHPHRRQQNDASFSTEESSDVLAVIEDHPSLTAELRSATLDGKNKRKGEGGSSSSVSKSPFRFIGRSNKANKEKKSDTLPRGFEDVHPVTHQQEGSAERDNEHHSSPEANIELSTQSKLAAGGGGAEKEKPSKKRMSLVKSFVGKTILRGGGSGNKKADEDGSKTSSRKEPVIFYKNAGGAMSDSESSGRKQENQEIVRFDQEPRVRTPKAGRRQRLNSGSGTSGSTASSSVTCTPPPPLPTTEPPQQDTTTSASEKDREIYELEVSETSIDISPVRKTRQLSYFDLRKKKSGDNKANKSDDCNDDGVEGKVSNRDSPDGLSSFNNPNPSSTPNKSSKKTKSQSLITSLVSLSPTSSTFSGGKSMEEKMSNKKKRNFKKSQKKLPQETTSVVQQQSLVVDQLSASTQVGKETENVSAENNNCLPVSTSGRRRKSSEDFKELRKNGIAFVGNEDATPVLTEDNKDATKIEPGYDDDGNSAAIDAAKEKIANEDGDNKEVDETDDPETACTTSFRQLKPFNYDLEPVEEGKKERLYKVLVVGELGAGKTSIIKRYVHQFFSQHYRATIGVDFALKVLRWDPDTVVRLQLWDIAGQERFGSMTRVYFKEAVGAFVVFDVTRSATLEAVPKWKADLDAKVALPDGRPIPTVLLANKSDQPKEGIAANREKMNDFCQQQGFSAWFETSAKDNINIDESANFLVSKILEMDKWSQEPLAADPDKVELTSNGKHKGSSPSNCAC